MKISKQPIIICWLVMLWAMPASGISGNVYPFEGLDTLGNRLQKVYSPGVRASWLGESSYFWYENRERKGNRILSRRRRKRKEAAGRHARRAGRIPGRPPRTGRAPQGADAPSPAAGRARGRRRFARREMEGVHPEQQRIPGFAHRQGCGSGDPEQRRSAGICLRPATLVARLKKLAAMKVREVKERQIPLLESTPNRSSSPSSGGSTMQSRATCFP